MIIKGGPAGAVGFWSKHLMRDDTNESAEVKEVKGLLAENLQDALKEMQALAAQSRSRGNFMYQANINPRADEHLTQEQWTEAVDTLEKNLGLEGHQRVVIEHVKNGREHRHVVWNRVDVDTLRVADMGGNWRIHTATARELEQRFGLSPTPSPDQIKDPDRKAALDLYEIRAAERSGIDPLSLTEELSKIWGNTLSGEAFKNEIEKRGYILAKGDRRDFCVVDHAGDAHSLARRLEGVRAKDVREGMEDVDRKRLPTVAEARQMQLSRSDGKGSSDRGHGADATSTPQIAEPNLADRATVTESRQAEIGKTVEVARNSEASERSEAQARETVEQDKAAERAAAAKQSAEAEPAPKPAPSRAEMREIAEAMSKLRAADRADNAVLRISENEAFEKERRERREAAVEASTQRWEKYAESESARVDQIAAKDIINKPAIAVIDAATGVATGLADFVTGLLAGRPSRPKEFSAGSSIEQIQAQRRAMAALENIRERVQRGEGLFASDIHHLTPSHLETIRLNGDDGLRAIIDSVERNRPREIDWGRFKER